MPDRVVLRFWRDSLHNPIALFVDQPESLGMVNSYQHIGQHGAASVGVVYDTKPVPANDPAGLALLAELRGIGYEPRVLRRVPANRIR